jgi:hypothetical protein
MFKGLTKGRIMVSKLLNKVANYFFKNIGEKTDWRIFFDSPFCFSPLRPRTDL